MPVSFLSPAQRDSYGQYLGDPSTQELQPTQIMTDTGAYSDVVFGLFRLLGYRFSPRLADIGGTRFWRIDSRADYGPLNRVARQSVNLDRITPQWDDMLRTVGSLKLGRVPATGIMRTLQVGDRPTRLAQAFAEFGRIDKTIHTLTYLDDEAKRRATLIQTEPGRRSPCLGPRRLPRQTSRSRAAGSNTLFICSWECGNCRS